jgi:hypothetical protein
MGDLKPHSRHHENVINQSPIESRLKKPDPKANGSSPTCIVYLARHAPPSASEQARASLGLQVLQMCNLEQGRSICLKVASTGEEGRGEANNGTRHTSSESGSLLKASF